MAKHDKQLTDKTKQTVLKLALGTGTFVGAVALTTLTVSADTYTVKAGDTLSEIAHNYDPSVAQLEKLTHIANDNQISIYL